MSEFKSENRIQQECYMWFWNSYPQLRGLLFAVPNGGARSSTEGRLFKLTGVVPGVSDMILAYNGKTYFFELKTKTGRQSNKQKAWQKSIEQQGFDYYIIRDLSLFKIIIKSIIK